MEEQAHAFRLDLWFVRGIVQGFDWLDRGGAA
jgi:hypothetical protein